MNTIFTQSNNATVTSSSYPIILVDCSGSTIDTCTYLDSTIFLNFAKKIDKLIQFDKFYLQFWSDSNYNIGLVEKSKIFEIFRDFYIKNIKFFMGTLLCPSIDNIPTSWFDNNDIYIMTDGEINDDKEKLSNSFINLVKNHPNININIITVENCNYNDLNDEIAGTTLYKYIKGCNLTNLIRYYCSYNYINIDEPFINFYNPIMLEGMIPYEDINLDTRISNLVSFKISDFEDFTKYIISQINKLNNICNDNKIELFNKMLYSITRTLIYVMKYKPPYINSNIINFYCKMFESCNIMNYGEILLFINNEINNHSKGSSSSFQDFRKERNKIYTDTFINLCKSVKSSISIDYSKYFTIPTKIKNTDQYITHILNHNQTMKDNIIIDSIKYNNACYKYNSYIVPSLPLNLKYASENNKQAIRQWVRTIYSKMYGVDLKDDIIIYLVLTDMLRINLSNAFYEIKEAYINLGKIMLGRVRVQENQLTEMQHLENGNPPISTLDQNIIDILNNCIKIFNMSNIRPYSLWYLIILVLNNPILIKNQHIFCEQSLKLDFNSTDINYDYLNKYKEIYNPMELIIFDYHNLDSNNLDYICYISLDDTSETGGYYIKSHYVNGIKNVMCMPKYVISESVYNDLLSKKDDGCLKCPLCYNKLNSTDYIKTIPKNLKVKELELVKNNLNEKFNNIINNLDNKFNCDIIKLPLNPSDNLVNINEFTDKFNNNIVLDVEYPIIISNNMHKIKIKTNQEFVNFINENYQFLNTINTENVYIMGGFNRSILYGQTVNDIDMFLVNLNKNEFKKRALNLIKDINNYYSNYYKLLLYKKEFNVFEILILNSNNNLNEFINEDSVTILEKFSDSIQIILKIQIVLANFNDIHKLHESNDLWASDTIYDCYNRILYITEKSYYAFKYNINVIDNSKYSALYDLRLKKYFNYGFNIVMPNLDIKYVKDDEILKLSNCIFKLNKVINNQIFLDHFEVNNNNCNEEEYQKPLYESVCKDNNLLKTINYIRVYNRNSLNNNKIMYSLIKNNLDIILDDYIRFYNGDGILTIIDKYDYKIKHDWYSSYGK